MNIKNMAKILIAVALVTLVSCAIADNESNELIISKNIVVEYEQPESISHTWQLLMFKYSDWYFSHQVVDPKTMYRGVDLTGMLQDFIRSMFDAENRKKLPTAWLAELSREQSEAFGINPNNSSSFTTGFGSIYQMYNEDDARGEIFIIEDSQTHWLQVHADKRKFLKLIESIKER